MRNRSIISFCAIALIATAALAQDVKTDYDHSTDFSKYRTYTWIKEPEPANPLMKQRIIDAINAQLQTKGLRLVSGNADLGVAAHTATATQQSLESFYNGYPGWGYYWGPVTTYVETYEVGTLVVDLFDVAAKQVKWRGVASDTLSDKPDKNVKKLNKAVEKMFKHFPPEGKRQTD
jgi:hypothetical protein